MAKLLYFRYATYWVSSFPRRRESIFEIQKLFFKSRFLKFYDGFPP
ncbi:pilS cassette [Neisseria mucosa]|nr:pilS cassette [Neisseria mucosa]